MRRIAEKPLAEYHPQVGSIWRTREDEPEQEVFDGLPDWMQPEQPDLDHQRDVQQLIAEVLDSLTEREAEILRWRFWEDYTLEEVAKELGVTRERIRQIECKAMRKLRHPSRRVKLLPYSLWSEWFKLFARREFKTPNERRAALWNVQKRIEYPIGLWGFMDKVQI